VLFAQVAVQRKFGFEFAGNNGGSFKGRGALAHENSHLMEMKNEESGMKNYGDTQ
jgi:hypothetical protein